MISALMKKKSPTTAKRPKIQMIDSQMMHPGRHLRRHIKIKEIITTAMKAHNSHGAA